METKSLVRGALLVAAALALSYMERFIPLNLVVPLPGVKLGLANIVTMFALYVLSPRQGICILLLRCVLGSVFGGGLSGFLGGTAMFVGIPVGIVGIVLVALAWPLYNCILQKERRKIAPEILRMTDELLQ